MKILSRYVFREILSSSFLATSVATFVIFLQVVIARLFAIMVRSPNGPIVAKLFVLALPPVLVLSVPFGVLVGILVGLGRLSSDNEIVAMRSAGVSTRVVVAPVLTFATLALMLCGACALWLNPLAVRAEYKIMNQIGAAQSLADVEPRVFAEQFTNDNTVLYVDDVKSESGPLQAWYRVFIADITPPGDRKTGLKDAQPGPRVTVAQEALAVPDSKNHRMELTLKDYGMHEAPYHSIAPVSTVVLTEQPSQQQTAKKFQDMMTRELLGVIRATPRKTQDGTDARIELQRRFALPFACVMLAMVGIPLGTSAKKGGRSAGYVWAIFLAFFCYYVGYITLTNLAHAHSINIELASWIPNAAFGMAGLILIARMEIPGDLDLIGRARDFFVNGWASLSARFARARSGGAGSMRFMFFQILDSYVLSNFLFYFVVWLAGFVTMVQVFQFFDLLGDIVKNNVPFSHVIRFHIFLTPQLIYDTMPESVLLAVLVTFGVMTKNNEVTAFKACGISVRRLALPVLVMSAVLSVGLFAFNYSLLPEANQIQDAIHNEIKGRPVQTYLHPERKWIKHDNRIFYLKGFDPSEKELLEPYVYELDPRTFHLIREISANRARWQQNIQAWVWEQGTARDLCGAERGVPSVKECKVQNFTATTFPELNETPDDFLKEVKLDKQMNYHELAHYIRDLQNSGFDTVKLRVQYYRKFSVPLFALIMALISLPFGFLVGNRGAMAGIGVSIAIAMAYLGVEQLFEQVGNVNYLPAAVAAWAPDVLFSLAGLYLMARMRT